MISKGLNIIPMRSGFVVRSRLKTCEEHYFIFEATKLNRRVIMLCKQDAITDMLM
jgi:hypothetical protein